MVCDLIRWKHKAKSLSLNLESSGQGWNRVKHKVKVSSALMWQIQFLNGLVKTISRTIPLAMFLLNTARFCIMTLSYLLKLTNELPL